MGILLGVMDMIEAVEKLWRGMVSSCCTLLDQKSDRSLNQIHLRINACPFVVVSLSVPVLSSSVLSPVGELVVIAFAFCYF
jgi:hypothetical protein